MTYDKYSTKTYDQYPSLRAKRGNPHLLYRPYFNSIIMRMTDIGKFLSDVEKLKKHARNNKPGFSGYNDLRDDLRNLFERATSCPMGLPGSVFEYWENTYILNGADLTYEPGTDNSAKLGAFLAFLDNSDEDQDLITNEDWQEIGRLVNYEAEDLPVNRLKTVKLNRKEVLT